MKRTHPVYILPKSLASELRELRESGKAYSFGADDQGRDPVRDAILHPNTSVEDIAYFVEVIISLYDSQKEQLTLLSA